MTVATCLFPSLPVCGAESGLQFVRPHYVLTFDLEGGIVHSYNLLPFFCQYVLYIPE